MTKSIIAPLAYLAALSVAASAKAEVSHYELLTVSGVKGGLVVCVGCDDPQLLADLGPPALKYMILESFYANLDSGGQSITEFGRMHGQKCRQSSHINTYSK